MCRDHVKRSTLKESTWTEIWSLDEISHRLGGALHLQCYHHKRLHLVYHMSSVGPLHYTSILQKKLAFTKPKICPPKTKNMHTHTHTILTIEIFVKSTHVHHRDRWEQHFPRRICAAVPAMARAILSNVGGRRGWCLHPSGVRLHPPSRAPIENSFCCGLLDRPVFVAPLSDDRNAQHVEYSWCSKTIRLKVQHEYVHYTHVHKDALRARKVYPERCPGWEVIWRNPRMWIFDGIPTNSPLRNKNLDHKVMDIELILRSGAKWSDGCPNCNGSRRSNMGHYSMWHRNRVRKWGATG